MPTHDMPPDTTATWVTDKLLSWASDVDQNTLQQAARASRMPFIEGHIALMPDAHFGMGATVGSVIPTRGAIMPAAVGVDVGCGMIAVETDIDAQSLPDSLDPLLSRVERVVPAGVGQGHELGQTSFWSFMDRNPNDTLTNKQLVKSSKQFGSLGSGNHFVEVCLDENDTVWVVLHSGSRGIGNELAQSHINRAKGLLKERMETLEDVDLAYFVEGTQPFQDYIRDLHWGQAYALNNREVMMDRVMRELLTFVGKGREVQRINCHHNYASLEEHGGKEVWVTRKGAIRMRDGDLGVIPGSMGASSFIVSGLGNDSSYHSASHGAGRRMSRGQAKRSLSVESLEKAMGARSWLSSKAQSLLDEHPDAYKDIDQVMSDQEDLVRVEHRLDQILNYKGL